MVHCIFFACTIWLLNSLPNFVTPFVVCGFNYNLKYFLVEIILVAATIVDIKMLKMCPLAHEKVAAAPWDFIPREDTPDSREGTPHPILASRPPFFPALNPLPKREQKSGENDTERRRNSQLGPSQSMSPPTWWDFLKLIKANVGL